MELAPVLVLVLDRDVHFKNCINSLVNNPLSKETHLFVALDAPSAEKHKTGYARVLDIIKNIRGFREVTIFKRDKNVGALRNQILALEVIFDKYDRLIYTEDDNIFSPNFLDFVNQGLELFKDRRDIFSISGHNYLIDIPGSYSSNYYVWPGFDAWGVGLWKEKWNRVDSSIENNRKKALSLKQIFKLNAIAGHYVNVLSQVAKSGVIYDDFAAGLHLIENNMYSVFPTISKVRNKGMDGSGEHSGTSELYSNQIIDNALSISLELDEGCQPNASIYRILKKFFSIKYKTKIKIFFRYVPLFLFRKRKLTNWE